MLKKYICDFGTTARVVSFPSVFVWSENKCGESNCALQQRTLHQSDAFDLVPKIVKELSSRCYRPAAGKFKWSGSHLHQGLAGDVQRDLGVGKNVLVKSFGALYRTA